MLNTIFGSFSTGVAPVTTSYESIATVTVGSGGASSVSFTSIPSTYTHLQIRGIARSGTTIESYVVQFNSDTGSNYSWHQLIGDGATASASGSASQTLMVTAIFNNSTSTFGGSIIDILDYANTNKYKTVRTLSGYDANGSGYVTLRSGSWQSTNAITSIVLTAGFAQYSQFALYGIKGS